MQRFAIEATSGDTEKTMTLKTTLKDRVTGPKYISRCSAWISMKCMNWEKYDAASIRKITVTDRNIDIVGGDIRAKYEED